MDLTADLSCRTIQRTEARTRRGEAPFGTHLQKPRTQQPPSKQRVGLFRVFNFPLFYHANPAKRSWRWPGSVLIDSATTCICHLLAELDIILSLGSPWIGL